MIGVLKIVLVVLGYLELVTAVLYLNEAFQTEHSKLLSGDSSKSTMVMVRILMGQLAALHAGLATINVFSWKMGSDMRPRVAVANIIVFAGIAIAYYCHTKPFPVYSFPVILALVGTLASIVGLVFHQMEPGFLTEDKLNKDSKKRS